MKSYNFHLISLLVLVVFFSVLCPHKSHAALTKQLSYQGRLNNASGQPVANGTYSIVFSIYNVSSGGSALWTETQNVNVESGGFSAYLGSVTALTLPFNEDYYLGIKVGSDPEMTPRLKLAIVGTAAFAIESDKLQGKAASDFALSTHNHDSNYSASAHTHPATGVTQIVAGTNVTISPADGTGVVTINAAGGGGGSSLTPASTVQPVTSASVVGTSLNYAREDHQHNIVSNFITDSMVSSSAGIATSKLSGTVTAISGHGLGSLATLNSVGSAQITDGTITLSDISQNGCTSGQIIKWNGSAWQCDSDLTGGGGGIVTNPSSIQTIQGTTAGVTPLALQGQSAQSAALFDVKDFSGGSLVKVAPSGNLLVGNPAQIAPKLSVEDTSINPGIAVQQKGTGAALDVWQSGTSGSAGVFSITNAGNTSDLISGDLSGTGSLLKLSLSGVNKFVVDKVGNVTATSFSGSGSSLTGVSASDPNAVKLNPAALQTIQPTADVVPLILKDDAASTANLFDIQNNGGTTLLKVNPSGNLLVGNPTTTTSKISTLETGTTQNAGRFEINNASSAFAALIGVTNGTGKAASFVINGAANSNPVLSTQHSGTGSGAQFDINNVSNSSSVIVASTTGTGNLLQLQKSGVDKFVVDNTGAITVGTVPPDPNAMKKNPAAAQTIQPSADVVPLIIKDDAAATADLFDVQNNASASLVKVNSTGNLLVGNPAYTAAKFSAEETGTNYAGFFKVNNASNALSAIYAVTTGTGSAVEGYTSGTGYAGNFAITNGANSSALLFGNNAGTGNLLQLQQSGVNKFVVNNSGNITTVGTALVTGLNADKLDGYDVTAFAQNATSNDINTTAGNPAFIINQTSTGDLVALKVSGTNKFKVDNTGNVLLDGNANPSIKASGATPNLILDADGTGASIVKVKNTTSPGSVVLQVEGNITAFNGTNAVPVTDTASQELIQKGSPCEGVGTAGFITVTFGAAFAGVPVVTYAQTSGTAAAAPTTITAKNASSFTVSGFETGGTTECIDWIAIGLK